MDKQEFIDMALREGMLDFGENPYSLKSGRQSRLWFNMGNADDGEVVGKLEEIYADLISEDVGDKPVVCFGIPYKCVNVASHAATGLMKKGHKAKWNTYRKEEKEHGGDAKAMLVARGDNIKLCGGRVAVVDDVMTTGQSKYDAQDVLKELAVEDEFKLDVVGVYLLVDREEVSTIDPSVSAIKQFEEATGYKVKSYIKATELIEAGRKKGLINEDQYKSFLTYFRVYGAPEVLKLYVDKKAIEAKILTQPLFMPIDRGIWPACDFTDLELYKNLLEVTADLDKVSGVKVSSLLAKEHSLGKIVEVTKKIAPNKKIINDHQKAGSDIAEMVYKQVQQDARLGCDATIIFPVQGGTEALLAGIHSGYEHGINVIVGSHMTHHGFLREDGGCATLEDCERFYKIAGSKGIRNFVMPGTFPEYIRHYREMLANMEVAPICIDSPGLVQQGGNISEGGMAAGKYYNGIVGRYIYEVEGKPGIYRKPDEMRRICEKLIKRL
ncbi:MAG TPA: phosphoribosyltransferase family protein [archaeon]|jgi:orotate phosphoribosyltransferase|nr:phosphoribosyltransferase family protein [archaeon]